MTTERTPQDVLREAAEAALTDFVYEHGSDFDAETWPGMAMLRTVLDKAIVEAPDSPPDENAELLRRLDSWKEGDNPGPLIRWAATHLRGEVPDTLSEKPGLDVVRLVALIRIGFLDGTDRAERVLTQLGPDAHKLLMRLLTAPDTQIATARLGSTDSEGR